MQRVLTKKLKDHCQYWDTWYMFCQHSIIINSFSSTVKNQMNLGSQNMCMLKLIYIEVINYRNFFLPRLSVEIQNLLNSSV